MDTPEELLRLDCATAAREIAALCHCSCFLCHHFFCPGSFRRCAHILRCSNCVTTVERACLVCEILTAHVLAARSGRLLSIHADRHTGLADRRRGVPADWDYGILPFSTEDPTLPHRRLALVPGNTGSGYRTRS